MSQTMREWAEGHRVLVNPDGSRMQFDDAFPEDAVDLAAKYATIDPEADAIWDKHLPSLNANTTTITMLVPTAVVISEALRGGFVPKKVREEAFSDWQAANYVMRDEYVRDMAALLDDLIALGKRQYLDATGIFKDRDEWGAAVSGPVDFGVLERGLAILQGMHRQAAAVR